MTERAVLVLHLGDHLRLRRAHPCGSREWEVDRLGADIGLTCLGCRRRILVERSHLERRVVDHTPVARTGEATDPAGAGLPGGGT